MVGSLGGKEGSNKLIGVAGVCSSARLKTKHLGPSFELL